MNALTLPQQIARMDGARLGRYRENLAFYQGRHWPGEPRPRRRLTFNYAKAIVDKATSYAMDGLSFDVDPSGDTPESVERADRARAVLLRAFEENNLAQLDFDTELDCAILGDAAYKVVWDPGRALAAVSSPDVQGLYVWWLGDDVSRIWRVASRYLLSVDEAQMLYGPRAGGGARGRIARSRDAEVLEVWTAGEFHIWLNGELLEERSNPYGFIPFVIYPNIRQPKQFWGDSDLDPIKESIRELNRALTQLSAILEISGNPIAVLENVSESQDIAVQPGAVWELPESARAYLLDLLQGGGVRLHAEYVDLIYRTLHDLAESPRTAFGENRGGLSGIALQMELDPLLKKVQRKRRVREAALRRRNEMILRLHERHTGEALLPCRLRVNWGTVLPQDRSRLAEDERTLVESGIHSRRTAAAALGVHEPDAEFERWLEEESRARP